MPEPKYKVVTRPMNGQNLTHAAITELLNNVANEDPQGWEFVQMTFCEHTNEVIYVFHRGDAKTAHPNPILPADRIKGVSHT